MRKVLFAVSVVMLVCLLSILSAMAKPANASRAADEREIKQLMLQKDHIPSNFRTKFYPIKIADSWARVCYIVFDRDPHGQEISSGIINEADLGGNIFKKSGGKWRLVVYCYIEGITPNECRKVGLPLATAKKIGVLVFQVANGAEEKEIQRVVLKATHFTGLYEYDGGVAKTKPKFDPIEFDGCWASAHYDQTSTVRGLEYLPREASYLLKKSGGKWIAVYEYGGGMMLKELKKVGLSPATARRLGIQVSNVTDGDEGHFLH